MTNDELRALEVVNADDAATQHCRVPVADLARLLAESGALAKRRNKRRKRIATAVLPALVTAEMNAHGVSWSGSVTLEQACIREAFAYADALIAALDAGEKP
jgi:hypothetical protein